MDLVETTTFRLAAGCDEARFLEADRRVQTELIPNEPGFMRRTTARRVDPEGAAEWLVLVLWASKADAEAHAARAASDPVGIAFDACIEPGSVRVRRYLTLD